MASAVDNNEQAATEVKAPSSTVGETKVRKVKGVEVTFATCRFCSTEMVVSEGFFPFKRIAGAYHIRSRCRSCEKAYRQTAALAVKDGSRVVKPRAPKAAVVEEPVAAPKPKARRTRSRQAA
jgi:hypothetical protein